MTRDELERLNVGENLDAIMNMDPRGYGVCRILYAGSRAYTGEPVAMHAAQVLCDTLQAGDLVYIIVGFVLLPHKAPETDGTVAALLLARSLVQAFDCKPVLVCPEDSIAGFKATASVVGLHVYEDLDMVMEMPMSMGLVSFTKDKAVAPTQASALAARGPRVVISIEGSGANERGINHNAVGRDVTAMQARSEVLWDVLRQQGVTNIAIGDLGNEIGMGTIAPHIRKYIPFTGIGECKCGCGGGTLSATSADNIITATCSDWGGYALMAALAYLKRDMEILHTEEMEAEVMRVAARNGFIDMTGSLIPGIDGFDTMLNTRILGLMRELTSYAVRYSHNSDHWFGPVLDKGFYEERL